MASTEEDLAPTTIAITSGKGGVGKSSLALNLATVWGSRSRRVLLFDANLALASIHVLAGLTPILTLSDFLTGRAPLEDIVVRTPAGVDILAATSGHPAGVDTSPWLRDMLIERIRQAVSSYDVVLVDTAPGLTGNVLAFASACDEALVVTTPEPTSLCDAYALLAALSQRGSKAPVSIAMNMASDSAAAHRAADCLHTAARRFLNKELSFAGQVRFDPLVPVAVRRQQPFVTLFPESPASRDLRVIAEGLESPRARRPPPDPGFQEGPTEAIFGKRRGSHVDEAEVSCSPGSCRQALPDGHGGPVQGTGERRRRT